MACKVTLQKMAEYEALGFEFIFTDGSAKTTEGIGAVGGYGCHRPGKWEYSAYLPIRKKQTNNRAELYAVIKAIDKATLATLEPQRSSEWGYVRAHTPR